MNSAPLLRRARVEEAAQLTALALAGKRHWGYPAEWLALWRFDLTVTADYIRTQPVIVAEVEGAIVGFAGLLHAAEGDQLEHLWLRPDCIGQGLGRRLFAGIIDQARPAGMTELQIKSDPNAEGFYLKMGAVRTGEEVYELPGGIRRVVPLLKFRIQLR